MLALHKDSTINCPTDNKVIMVGSNGINGKSETMVGGPIEASDKADKASTAREFTKMTILEVEGLTPEATEEPAQLVDAPALSLVDEDIIGIIE
ncbi:hypothetical protein B296_00042864 [Ensete ventricosum]|uniref:Uncharacterized protein n=1 Tax=Ensete ventricosum TaxID=4639 RepID=A0A426Y1K8_ENSVE|nr:hypothetical protein B296_00042864 [Ensete ventricosum]